MEQGVIKFVMMDLHILHMEVLTMDITQTQEQRGVDQLMETRPMDIHITVVVMVVLIGPILIMEATEAELATVGS